MEFIQTIEATSQLARQTVLLTRQGIHHKAFLSEPTSAKSCYYKCFLVRKSYKYCTYHQHQVMHSHCVYILPPSGDLLNTAIQSHSTCGTIHTPCLCHDRLISTAQLRAHHRFVSTIQLQWLKEEGRKTGMNIIVAYTPAFTAQHCQVSGMGITLTILMPFPRIRQGYNSALFYIMHATRAQQTASMQ